MNIIGIDLGTSNSALALYRETLDTFPILQIASTASVVEQQLLPSAVLLLPEHEQQSFAALLPWRVSADRPVVVGSFAKSRGALTPDALVTSAKSWLSVSGAEKRKPILPWGSSIDAKLSPFDVSRLVLEHLFRAVREKEKSDPSDMRVVLTVPASFDEEARSLTYEAALAAGWKEVTLLEEPQAALYAWLSRNESEWRKKVSVGDLILVCDVGGGTTDFSLIAVEQQSGDLELKRISVGEHILLGGDNMDLALAHFVRGRMEEQGTNLDTWQFMALIQACRDAKEKLFSDRSLMELPVTLPSRGASLFTSSVSTVISRADLESIVLEGFFPLAPFEPRPKERRGLGLRDVGLPYASDPAITHHLADFLLKSGKLIDTSKFPGSFPTHILFNGGIFGAEILKHRVLEVLNGWGGRKVVELETGTLDTSVAIGAAYYGRQKHSGKGIRIRSGLSRAYFIGVETRELAVPGVKPKIKGICVAPRGLEEGSEVSLPQLEFALSTGEEADFRLFSSPVAEDQAGAIVADAERELQESGQIRSKIEGSGEEVRVGMHARVTEVGTLDLNLRQLEGERTYHLQFSVRTNDE